MKISKEQRKQIKQIMEVMKCPRDFACYRSKFEKLSRVKRLVDGEVIECLEEARTTCKFGLTFGDSFLCTCPLRLYIAKHLRK